MLKTISAALLAASVLAAPALAAQATRTTANAPVIKSTQTQTKTAVQATGANNSGAKTTDAVLNSNAKMGKHHRKHISYHHRHHGKMSALKTRPTAHAKTMFKPAPKLSLKPAASPTKRG